MTKSVLRELAVDALVERFASIALAQDDAIVRDDHKKFNRLFDEMEAIKAELKSRPGDKRRALLPLYRHPNVQVRLKAVKATLAVEPEAARRQLEAIASSGELPQSGEAGMSLWNLERGTFKPT